MITPGPMIESMNTPPDPAAVRQWNKLRRFFQSMITPRHKHVPKAERPSCPTGTVRTQYRKNGKVFSVVELRRMTEHT